MKKIFFIVALFGLVGCSSDNSDSASVSVAGKQRIAPFGVYLGMSMDEFDKLYPDTSEHWADMTTVSRENMQQGKLYLFKNKDDKVAGNIVMTGQDLTDSLIDGGLTFGLIRRPYITYGTDAESGKRYISELNFERMYKIQEACKSKVAKFKDDFIEKYGEPEKIYEDEISSGFGLHYSEELRKKDAAGKEFREGAALSVRFSCSSSSPQQIRVQIFGTDYDLDNSFLPKSD